MNIAFGFGRAADRMFCKFQRHNLGDGLKTYTLGSKSLARAMGAVASLAASATLLASCSYSEPALSPATPSISQSLQGTTVSPPAAPMPDVAGKIGLSSYQLPAAYTTVDGDTWASIAAAFELKEESLKAFQTQTVDAGLKAGTVLDLRGIDYQRPGASGDYEKDPSGQPETYVVQTGDNPGAVAARFGIPVRDLVADNDLPGKWSLKPEDSASFLPGVKLKLQNPS